jgi:hypothetical protein
MGKVVDFAGYRAMRRRQRSRLARLLASARMICVRAFTRGDRHGLPRWRILEAQRRTTTALPEPPTRVVALRRPERR